MRGVRGTQRVVAIALAAFLVVVLPACWASALTQAFLDRGSTSAPANNEEENGENEESKIEETETEEAEKSPERLRPTTHSYRTRRATWIIVASRPHSVAPKTHPYRFSERRLR